MSDPLNTLPPELVLQIVDLLPPSDTARITRASRAWHSFIDVAHQDRIYSSPSKVARPDTIGNLQDFSFIEAEKTFTNPYHGVSHWKDLCKRQTLLRRNIDSAAPVTRESVFQITHLSRVWRFKPDFRRRLFLSTSEIIGGVDVTDMDSGQELWRNEDVREFAHLEYDVETGTAVWDAFGDVVEVWRVSADERQRGVFKQIAVLDHDCQIRGFELSHGNLCVVSSEGQAFVYDIHPQVTLRKSFAITNGAVGHLHQDRDVVVISMGGKGFHIYSKETGASLGVLDPRRCTNITHVKHKRPVEHDQPASVANMGPTVPPFPPSRSQPDRLIPLALEPGAHPTRHHGLDDDEWGSGLLDGPVMVGLSRAGRVFICSDWRRALAGDYDETSSLIECETDPMVFDLGGWLTVRHGKAAVEVDDCIYLISTSPRLGGGEQDMGKPSIWAMYSTSIARFNQPVSFMGIYEDCFMQTYLVSMHIIFPAIHT